MDAINWSGRSWQNISTIKSKTTTNNNDNNNGNGNSAEFPIENTVRVISYHVLADSKCKDFTYTASKYWDARSAVLLSEMMTYDADVIMLQDCDHFEDYWQPQLMLLGYDTVFKKRTQTKDTYDEGCAVAYKRSKFQLFKTVNIEFNDSVNAEVGMKTTVKEKCRTDDVALLAFLQPFASNRFPSAVCYACAQFPDKDDYADVRGIHAKYLCREIEKANAEFQVPVVVGLSMNDAPFSPTYHVMTCGRLPLTTLPPNKCGAPHGKPICTGSVKMKWMPPKMSLGEPQITHYRICWRPGGNLSLGFKSMMEVVANDCTQFEERVNKAGELRAVPLVELACVVAGLATETPYEFRVAAVNSLGQSEWSDISSPIVIPDRSGTGQLPSKILLDLVGVLEQQERNKMKENDYDIERMLSSNAHSSESQLTPRLMDGRKNLEVPRGRLLPLTVNPRDGWKSGLRGAFNTTLAQEMMSKEALAKTLLRGHDGRYLDTGVTDTPSGKLCDMQLPEYYRTFAAEQRALEWSDDEGDHVDEAAFNQDDPEADNVSFASSRSGLSNASSKVMSKTSKPTPAVALTSIPVGAQEMSNAVVPSLPGSVMLSEANSAFSDDEPEVEDETILSVQSKPVVEMLPIEELRKQLNESVEDDVIVDCRNVITNIGKVNGRQLHNLTLRSAYEFYSSGGEPSFTASRPPEFGVNACECVDYLMYTGYGFRVKSVLMLPLLSDLGVGQDSRELLTTGSMFLFRPLPPFARLFDSQLKLLEECASNSRVPEAAARGVSSANRSASATKQGKSPTSSRSSSARAQSSRNLSARASARKTVSKPSSIGQQPFAINAMDFRARLRAALDDSIRASVSVKDKFWGGSYVPDSIANPSRRQYWLPNDSFGSSHFCLGVELTLDIGNMATKWST